MAERKDDLTPEERAKYELIKQRAGKECVCDDCLRRALKQ